MYKETIPFNRLFNFLKLFGKHAPAVSKTNILDVPVVAVRHVHGRSGQCLLSIGEAGVSIHRPSNGNRTWAEFIADAPGGFPSQLFSR